MNEIKNRLNLILSKFFRSISDRMERNRVEPVDGENKSIKYLNVPLIGGLMYIASRYSHALKFNRVMETDKAKNDKIRKDIKEEYSITNSIRRQLEDYQMTGGTMEIKVDKVNSVYFKETLREFPGITCVDLGGGEYVISTNEDDL